MLGVLASLDPLRPAVFVLVLSTKRRNALAFLMGWAVALSLLFAVGFFVVGGSDMGGASSEQRTWISVMLLVIGGGLLVVAARRWSRRKAAAPHQLIPGVVLRRLDHLDTRQATILGALIQPTTLTIAAALVVARDRSGALSLLIGFAVFAVVSTAALLGIFIYDIRHENESSGWLSRVVELIERESPRLITLASALAGGYLVVDALRSLLDA